ncbi:hypothetical protein [Aureimonas sp. Leaf324]|uniref:hypothetical protein n=1 Tax=Aureimonas sp. Leaf324 TaxID=1736336 RepID=UPI0012E1C673|nr:hypothetical protein [Aureimonas sp. Leaf324]
MVTINLEVAGHLGNTPQFARKVLMNGLMPEGWSVAIGKMDTWKHGGWSYTRIFEFPLGLGEGRNLRVQACIFCVERVAFRTVSASSDRLRQFTRSFADFDSAELPRLIWPSQSSRSAGKKRHFHLDELYALQDSIA